MIKWLKSSKKRSYSLTEAQRSQRKDFLGFLGKMKKLGLKG
jgi:hypothetical protein